MVNGFDTLFIMKLDVLDILDEIPVCVRYRLHGKEVTEMPATYRALEAIEPVYEMMPGWRTSTRGISRFEELPAEARAYLKFLEDTNRRRSRRRFDGTGAQRNNCAAGVEARTADRVNIERLSAPAGRGPKGRNRGWQK